MPKLDPEIVEALERPIDLTGWDDALSSSKNGKNPGPDGLTL